MRKIVRRRRGINSIRKKSRVKNKAGWWNRQLKDWAVGIGAILLVGILLYFPVSRTVKNLFQSGSVGTAKVDRYRDLNGAHLRHAVRNGIKPFKTDKSLKEGIGDLDNNDKVVKISDNRYYVVKHLSHSYPYLVPEAADLLDDIGKCFRKKLDEKKKPAYHFQVSSLLRTGESQRKLGRFNRNASQNSAHLYGTTFDISYKSLVKKTFPGIETEIADGEAIKLLSEAVGELRRDGRCKVITEYYEKCFHITVVR